MSNVRPDPEIFLHKAQWNDSYKAWLQMGGSQYKQPTVIDRLLRKTKKLHHRIRLFGVGA